MRKWFIMKKVAIVFVFFASVAFVFHIGFANNKYHESADVVVFSCDRPLQLYAFLESAQKYVTGIGQMCVIYRSSNEQFKKGYDIVRSDFPHVTFLAQGNNPAGDFKPLTLKATFESTSTYIIFAVDDIVVKDAIDLKQCIHALEQHQAYAFFLRLGMNLNYCYPENRYQPLPPRLKHEGGDIFSLHFHESVLDWWYSHTVDMTLYRKKDIEGDLKVISYHMPNRLEGLWGCRIGRILSQKGLCFRKSKIVNLPLNKVQYEERNRSMNISAQALLDEFMAGKKMDIAQLYQIDNKSAHMEYAPTFVNRS